MLKAGARYAHAFDALGALGLRDGNDPHAMPAELVL